MVIHIRDLAMRMTLPRCAAFRVVNALLISSYQVPDEFWQGPEVAHHLVFGSGYLTWEWWPENKLRGWLHPLIFACLFRVLELSGLDSPWLIAYGPRLLQGVFAGVGDWATLRIGEELWTPRMERRSKSIDRLSILNFDFFSINALFQISNWFLWCMYPRTLSNSLEAVLLPLALLMSLTLPPSQQPLSVFCASLCVIIRPVSAVFWGPFFVRYVWTRQVGVVAACACVGVALLVLSSLLDSYVYQRVWGGEGGWTFVVWNFLKFNLLDGSSAFYGTQGNLYYFGLVLPYLLLSHLPFAAAGLYSAFKSVHWKESKDDKGGGELEDQKMTSPPPFSPESGRGVVRRRGGGRKREELKGEEKKEEESNAASCTFRWALLCMVLSMCVLSLSAHKEERFLLPFLPLLSICSSLGFFQLSMHRTRFPRFLLLFLLLPHLCLGLFFGHLNGVGPERVMSSLSSEVRGKETDSSILFLTDCHSTPFHSFLHPYNVSLHFLDCRPPPLRSNKCQRDLFFENPAEEGEKILRSLDPDYVVVWKKIDESFLEFLGKKYELKETIWDSWMKEGPRGKLEFENYFLIFERE